MENNGKGLLAHIRKELPYNTSTPLTLEGLKSFLENMQKQASEQKFRYRYPGALLITCSDKDFKVFYNRKDIEWDPVGSGQYKIIQDRIKKLIDE